MSAFAVVDNGVIAFERAVLFGEKVCACVILTVFAAVGNACAEVVELVVFVIEIGEFLL